MDEYAVATFTYMGPNEHDQIGLEFIYENGVKAAVFFPRTTLHALDDELTESLARNSERKGGPSRWALQLIGRQPVAGGPEHEVEAVRAERIQLFERLDGEMVVVVFHHEGLTPTVAALTTYAAQLLVQAMRDKIIRANA